VAFYYIKIWKSQEGNAQKDSSKINKLYKTITVKTLKMPADRQKLPFFQLNYWKKE